MSFISDAIQGFSGFVAQNMPSIPLPWEYQTSQSKAIESIEADALDAQEITPIGDELPAVLPSQDDALYEKVQLLSKQLDGVKHEKTTLQTSKVRKKRKIRRGKELEEKGQGIYKEWQEILFKTLNNDKFKK